MNPVEGYLDLPVFIGNTNVKHRFYVMKPGKVFTQVILGQPWQRTYNGVPNWRREGINFEYDHARLFTPFLTEEDFTTDSDSEEETETAKEPIHEDSTESKGLEKTTAPAAKQVPSQKDITQEQEEKQQEPRMESKQRKAPPRPKLQERPIKQKEGLSTAIWVPKELSQAQKGSPQIWIPKQVTQQGQPCKDKPTRRPRKIAPKKVASKYSTRVPQQVPTSGKKIWLPKMLLDAQQESRYKWVPKHLLKTLNTQQQSVQKMPPQRKQDIREQQLANSTMQKRWVPKHSLTTQGYYKGVTHIWLPKQAKKTTNTPLKQTQPTPAKLTAMPLRKMRVKKTEYKQQQVREVPPTVPPSKQRRATTQEKGKWVPKEAEATSPTYIEKLPSTSMTGYMVPQEEIVKERGPNKPSTLDSAQHLAFILKAFNSKQVQEHLRRFMTQSTGTQASSANTLGPHMLQDPSLAPH